MVGTTCCNNYPHAQAVINYGQNAWNKPTTYFLDLIKKVGEVALAILAFPFAWIYDLAIRFCCCIKKTQPLDLKGGVPDEQLVRRILQRRYDTLYLHVNEGQFFKDAIRYGLKLFNPKEKEIYKQLIRNEGVLDEGETPFDIYHWAARCLLAHFLISQEHSVIEYYPNQIGQNLYNRFSRLKNQEKAAILLQVLTYPTIEWTLNEKTRNFFNLISGKAQEMTQDKTFLNIYKPIIAEIDQY